MIQELITYAIIASALIFIFLRFRKKFGKKKKKRKNVVSKSEGYTYNQHNCSDCSAECVLRDISSNVLQNNEELCRKIESTSD